MANLIYRGVAHTGATETTVRSAMALIYRGQSHDGLTRAMPRRSLQLVYRGVSHKVVFGSEEITAPVASRSGKAPTPRRATAAPVSAKVAEYA